jgi:hypothetical protein
MRFTRNIRGIIPVVLVLAGVGALCVPARWQPWRPLAMLLAVLEVPVSGPVSRLVLWMRPPPTSATPREILAAREEVERYQLENHALREENRHYAELLSQLRVAPPSVLTGVEHAPATVVAGSSDAAGSAVWVRVGGGVRPRVGAVATIAFTQLFGRVTAVNGPLVGVLPITGRESPDLDAVIVLDEKGTALRARLSPVGGVLRGDLEERRDSATNAALEAKPGMDVRLSDTARWPAHAQMLRLGTVEKIEASPKHPLRKVVVVRPGPADPRDARELVVSSPRDPLPTVEAKASEGPR